MILLTILALFFKIGATNPVVGGDIVQSSLFHSAPYPFIVFLEIVFHNRMIGQCGGSVIREDAVLTAAHCLTGSGDVKEIQVWGGILDRKKDRDHGQRKISRKYTSHEKFNKQFDLSANDIAILWLESGFDLTKKIKVATLPTTASSFERDHGLVLGWGYTNCNQPSDVLRKTRLDVIKHAECQKIQPHKVILPQTIICAESHDKKSLHFIGDSGGPFLINNKLAGIISFSEKTVDLKGGKKVLKCNFEKPSFITNVSKFLDWIHEQLRKHQVTN